MLTGDIERKSEIRLVREYGDSLSADILLVPHHGSAGSSGTAFVERVAPRVAVATDAQGTPVTLVSDLSHHTRALRADPACSLLVGEPGEKGDPLTHPRLSLQGRMRKLTERAVEMAGAGHRVHVRARDHAGRRADVTEAGEQVGGTVLVERQAALFDALAKPVAPLHVAIAERHAVDAVVGIAADRRQRIDVPEGADAEARLRVAEVVARLVAEAEPVDDELALHAGFAKSLGIDLEAVRPLDATLAYTDFLLRTAWHTSLPATIAALAAGCRAVARAVGRDL